MVSVKRVVRQDHFSTFIIRRTPEITIFLEIYCMRVLVTGGTGFIGRYVVRELRRLEHEPVCLVRDPSNSGFPADVRVVEGDVTRSESLTTVFSDIEAVIHLVGIIEENASKGITFEKLHVEATTNVVDASRRAGIDRFIHMSANGARENGVSRYQSTKWLAEERVRMAGFREWTIFRPSLVFGRPDPDCPEFGSQLVRDLLRPFPIWPVFGDGLYEMQPVSVENVASAFVLALSNENALGKMYCLAGPEKLSYLEIISRLARGAGLRERWVIKQPLWLIRPLVNLLGGTLLPITIDQFEMLIDGNTCDSGQFQDDFGLDLVPFSVENLAYLSNS